MGTRHSLILGGHRRALHPTGLMGGSHKETLHVLATAESPGLRHAQAKEDVDMGEGGCGMF